MKIGNGIRSAKVKGDEVVELCRVDIEEVDASESNRYIVENGVLYEKDADGNKGSQVVVFNQEIDKGEYKYFIKPLKTILICRDGKTPLENFRIPQELVDQYDTIEIGPGIKSFELEEKQKISCKLSKSQRPGRLKQIRDV